SALQLDAPHPHSPAPKRRPGPKAARSTGQALAPRISLRLTTTPIDAPDRPAGTGSIEQILGDLDELRRLGADTVVLDPYHGDPEETRRPDTAWHALTTVATHWRTSS
ncbi:LLM class F420-dependent oxidoreductase, partial [Streptomyces sp. NPDC020719]